ncbi:MAG: 5-formyltetrahydrofolate cyclo-ligase [Pseudomonadota bacterium]
MVAQHDPVDAEKKTSRHQAREIRGSLHARLGPIAAIELANHFFASIPFDRNAVISAYWPMGSEIDVRPLCRRLREAGALTALPVVVERDKPLAFGCWDDRTELVEGPYGTHQPSAASPHVVPDILIVPLLAFDAYGSRLGYGGGYYDRTLAALRAERSVLAVGVAFDDQRVDRLTVGNHDARLDKVVTERDVYSPPSRQAI